MRPLVVIMVGIPGWAHDHTTRAIVGHLSDEFDFDVRYGDDLRAEDIERAHAVLIHFWWQARDRLQHVSADLRRHRAKVMVGISSHPSMAGEHREPGLRFFAESTGRAFVLSRLLHDEFAPLLDVPCHYVPCGVDTALFRPGRRRFRRGLDVGWAGSLDNHGRDLRGVSAVIEPAVAALPGARFRLAAREHRLRPHTEMPRFYQGLDVYACASTSEGTPNPCLEAAACGVPLVTTAVGNMPEFVEDGVNGFIVPRDVDAFARAFRLVREDAARRRSMGQAARQTALDWDWRKMVDGYRQLFAATVSAAGD